MIIENKFNNLRNKAAMKNILNISEGTHNNEVINTLSDRSIQNDQDRNMNNNESNDTMNNTKKNKVCQYKGK